MNTSIFLFRKVAGIIYSLKFDVFDIAVTDYVLEDDGFFTFDVTFQSKSLFNDFYSFVCKHLTEDTAFEYKVNEKSYHGHFGALIYDIDYNVRFYMTSLPDKDNDNHFETVLRFNLPKIIHNQEKRISSLVDILTEKGFITKDNSDNFLPYLPYQQDSNMDFMHQVKNLNEYLQYTNSTMNDIRNYIKEKEETLF